MTGANGAKFMRAATSKKLATVVKLKSKAAQTSAMRPANFVVLDEVNEEVAGADKVTIVPCNTVKDKHWAVERCSLNEEHPHA